MKILKKLFFPVLFLLVFYSVAVWRYSATGKTFYLFNFGYIGTALALGLFLSSVLPKKKLGTVRRITLVLIGVYLLVYVGIHDKEDLQIEGFWIYLFSGYLSGATLHYIIAKIIGPLIFNRGWCGWSCWTAMVLDIMPWKNPQRSINKGLTFIRYIHFIAILAAMIFLFFYSKFGSNFIKNDMIELYWLLIGNLIYYSTGIILAAALHDNRAFCKYVCPIPVFMKLGSRFSLLKNEIDVEKCIECKICEKNCPMQIKLLDYKNGGNRILSTECILCQTCESVCPKNAIRMTFRFDKKRRQANALT